MTIGRHHLDESPDLGHLALQLADALERVGDGAGTDAVLELAAAHDAADERIALRRAERGLARGDAVAALRALVPAWEAGSRDPHLEALLALVSLALGLDDVAQSLTGPPCASGEHALVRLILAASRGERLDVDPSLSTTERIWGLRSMLRILADCGRTDLVQAVVDRAEELALPGLPAAIAGIPASPAPDGGVYTPPLAEARAEFDARWTEPGGRAVFNWAWTVAREVGIGERLLLLGAGAPALRPLFPHAEGTVIAPAPTDGADAASAPGELALAPARWHHVVALGWLTDTLEPETALRRVVDALRHGGQLHLLVPGPRAGGEPLLRLSRAAVERLLERTGLVVEGVVDRNDDGLDVPPPEAAWVIARAARSIV